MKSILFCKTRFIYSRKVEDTHKESIDHAALRQQILGLREMNIQMSKGHQPPRH
jgi:hypothetical protein